MATEKREIEIALRSKSAEASADRLNTKVKNVGRTADGAERSFSSLTKVAASVGAALATNQIRQYADTWTNVNNRLRAATDTSFEFAKAQQGVIAIAQQAGVDIAGVADGYSRIAQNTAELGISQERLLDVTRKVTLAIKAGGATAQEASSVIVQLGQGLGAGALQGDELRSIMEASIPITKALAKEFGVTTGELKKLGSEGKITADRVVSAIENMDEKALTFTKDISSGFTEVNNALTVYVGKIDDSLGVTNTINQSLSGLAENIDAVVSGASSLIVIIGARYVGALSSSTAATLKDLQAKRAQDAANLKLLQSQQALAASQLNSAIQTQEGAKRHLANAANATIRAKAINSLAAANAKATAAQTSLTVATNAYTAAATRAGFASRALSGAVGLLGGPVGVAVTAAAAIAYYVTQSDLAAPSTEKYSDKVGKLTKNLNEVEEAQGKVNVRLRENLKIGIERQLDELNKKLAEQEQLAIQAASSGKDIGSGFTVAQAQSKKLREEIAKLKQSLFELQSGVSKEKILEGVFESPQTGGEAGLGEFGAPVDGAGGKKPAGDGVTTGQEKSFLSLKKRLELETMAIQEEAEVRKAFANEEINQRQLDEELALQSIFYNYEARRMAVIENEKMTAEQKAQLLEELSAQELAAEQAKQDELTAAARQGAEDRVNTTKWSTEATLGALSTGFNALANLESKNFDRQKKLRKASVVVDTASAIMKTWDANGGYPYAIPPALAMAAAGAAQLAQINKTNPGGGASLSTPSAGGASATTPSSITPPSVENQSQQKVIRFEGLENFGPDDMIPITKSQFESYISQSEEANIAINQGQQNAQRVGAI